ncbi:hypothetical protein DRO97_10645 [Archaeoglobales archaeon]|nr:MAG: hypothetical protein DRO97_10645 [Archaeoglobales archaeon]
MKCLKCVIETIELLESYGIKLVSQMDCLNCGKGDFESCEHFKYIKGLPCCLKLLKGGGYHT